MPSSHTLYEINALVWLNEQPWRRPDSPDLADVPDETVREWADKGIDVVWFLGVWHRGKASREICLTNKELYRFFTDLPDKEVRRHIVGSPFSVVDYALDPMLGDSTTLKRLREKLNARGIRMMLDYVPNHMAVDHPWVETHPGRFVRGTEETIQKEPCNYFRADGSPPAILAHGRDPYFAGWTDTVQNNVFSREMRGAMIEQLLGIVMVVYEGVKVLDPVLHGHGGHQQTYRHGAAACLVGVTGDKQHVLFFVMGPAPQ